MTLLVSFVWKDKIIMMADSRISKKDNSGTICDYKDNSIKIVPYNNTIVIGRSGLSNYSDNTINGLDTSKITKHFLDSNTHIDFANSKSDEIFKGLVDTWKSTLSQIPTFDPRDESTAYNLVLAKWDKEPSILTPMIHTYSSLENRIRSATGAVIGDDEAIEIIKSYCNPDLYSNLDFEDVIQHFKKGFQEVTAGVKSVGGFIYTYILEASDQESRWHDYKAIK